MRTDKKETLKIGYRNFTLSFVKKIDGAKSMGECVMPNHPTLSKGRIKVIKGLDGVEKANTVLHEIMHALCYVQGLELSAAQEERIVCGLTNGLIAFVRDNPRFFLKIIRAALRST